MAALIAALYETEYPADRLEALARRVAAIEEAAEEELHARREDMLENLAVNEFFLRLYPFACGGGMLTNFKLFALRFRLAEFSLLLSAAAEGAAPGEETALTMLGRVMERLDHSRDARPRRQPCNLASVAAVPFPFRGESPIFWKKTGGKRQKRLYKSVSPVLYLNKSYVRKGKMEWQERIKPPRSAARKSINTSGTF